MSPFNVAVLKLVPTYCSTGKLRFVSADRELTEREEFTADKTGKATELSTGLFVIDSDPTFSKAGNDRVGTAGNSGEKAPPTLASTGADKEVRAAILAGANPPATATNAGNSIDASAGILAGEYPPTCDSDGVLNAVSLDIPFGLNEPPTCRSSGKLSEVSKLMALGVNAPVTVTKAGILSAVIAAKVPVVNPPTIVFSAGKETLVILASVGNAREDVSPCRSGIVKLRIRTSIFATGMPATHLPV